jgi:hypothetical protein
MHDVLLEKPEGKEMLDKTSPGGKNIKNYLSEQDGKIRTGFFRYSASGGILQQYTGVLISP